MGNPGVLLASGRIVATWRPQKKGKRLMVNFEPFAALSGQTRDEIAAEAAMLAPFRGCTGADTLFAEPPVGL